MGLRNHPGEEAALITRPFRLDGDQLAINAVTDAAGWVKAEFVDPGGSIVPTLEIAKDCDPFVGDAVASLMSWHGNTTAPRRVAGEHVRLRLRWKDAEVFGFRIFNRTRASPGCRVAPSPSDVTRRPPAGHRRSVER